MKNTEGRYWPGINQPDQDRLVCDGGLSIPFQSLEISCAVEWQKAKVQKANAFEQREKVVEEEVQVCFHVCILGLFVRMFLCLIPTSIELSKLIRIDSCFRQNGKHGRHGARLMPYSLRQIIPNSKSLMNATIGCMVTIKNDRVFAVN